MHVKQRNPHRPPPSADQSSILAWVAGSANRVELGWTGLDGTDRAGCRTRHIYVYVYGRVVVTVHVATG